MTPATIIEQAAADGVKLSLNPTGSIKATGETGAVNRWLSVIRETKPGIVAALQEATPARVYSSGLAPVKQTKTVIPEATRNDPEATLDAGRLNSTDARSERVLAMLDSSPGIKHALTMDTKSDPEDVILTVGIRDLATAELRIARAKYNAFAIMKAVETVQ